MSITQINFINRYPLIKTVPARVVSSPVSNSSIEVAGRQDVEWVFRPTEFKLGLGPCGKVVTYLSAYQTDHSFTINQTHEDGTSKDFIYQMNDIAGRIVIEYTEEQDNV